MGAVGSGSRLLAEEGQGQGSSLLLPGRWPFRTGDLANILYSMHRRDLVQALARSTSDQDNVVVYPDHPLLVRGPDVLARDDDGLVAYFVFATRDPRPGSVASRTRTLLSRLALPEGTEFVLVCESCAPELRDGDVELFDAVRYGVRPVRDHRSGLEPSGFAPGGVVAGLRPFHMRRFGDAWAMRNEEQQAESLRQGDGSEMHYRGVPLSVLGELSGDRWPRLPRSMDFSSSGVLYASPRSLPSDRTAVIRQIRQWISAAVDVDYPATLDSLSVAVSALHSHDAYLPLHRARTGPLFEGKASDILKPYRAAAFAGFHTIIGGA